MKNNIYAIIYHECFTTWELDDDCQIWELYDDEEEAEEALKMLKREKPLGTYYKFEMVDYNEYLDVKEDY